MNFYKIRTSRASLRKLIASFKANLGYREFLVAPRPKQGALGSTFYFAYCGVRASGANEATVKRFNNCIAMSREECDNETSQIRHSWTVGACSSED